MEEDRLYDLYALDEDIKDLEKYIAFSKKSDNFSHNSDWKWHKELSEKIGHLIERVKKLEVINKMQEYRISVIDERELIPKSKVKEKIEEYNRKIVDAERFDERIEEYRYKKYILQELLEEEE